MAIAETYWLEQINKNLARIAVALEKANDLKELELMAKTTSVPPPPPTKPEPSKRGNEPYKGDDPYKWSEPFKWNNPLRRNELAEEEYYKAFPPSTAFPPSDWVSAPPDYVGDWIPYRRDAKPSDIPLQSTSASNSASNK